MMKDARWVLMLACLTVNGVLHAQSVQGKAGAENSAQGAKGARPPAAQDKRPAPKPAKTFKPSERIGADSAVSFPVDI
jgi:hypothetical protein